MTSEASRRPFLVRMRRPGGRGSHSTRPSAASSRATAPSAGVTGMPPRVRTAKSSASSTRGFGIEHLVAGFDRRPGPDRGDVALRGAEVPPPAAVEVPVRGGADREVVTLVPVEDVVPALATGSGPVRDLVPLVPGAAQDVVGDLVLLGLVVVVGRPAPAAAMSWPSGVPGSTVSAYALTWSGSSPRTPSRLRRQSSIDSHGEP